MANNPLYLLRTARIDPAAFRLAWLAIRRHRAVQSLWELTHLIAEVKQLRPKNIVEIGTHLGGTLYCWPRAIPQLEKLVSLDLPADPGDSRTTVPVLQKLIPDGMQKNCEFIRDDSHLPTTLEKVRAALADKPADFLFIDGDHSYEGVKQDYEMYRSLVRSGGLIAFHDILPNPDVADYGVARFWQELKETRETHEFVDPQQGRRAGMGIGVVPVA